MVSVTLEHDTHDVLADVVDVSLHRGQEHASLVGHVGLLGLQVRDEVRHGLLHDSRALNHLGEEHATAAEAIAHDVHAVHERSLDHVERPRKLEARGLRVLSDELVEPLNQRVEEPFPYGPLPPGEIFLDPPLGCALALGGNPRERLCGFRIAREQHVLDRHQEVLGDLIVHRHGARIDDADV